MKKETITKSTLFSYGVTALPLAMLGLPLYIYLPTFYAQSVGLNVTLVGIILFISRFTDVITDPLVGIYSDTFKSRYGKRKPFLVIGAIVLIISFYALIHPPQQYHALWLLLFSMMVYLGWSIFSIPYLAWSAEISYIDHDKTKLSASRELFTIIGGVTALIIPYFYGVSEDASRSIVLLYYAFVIAIFVLLPITLFHTPRSEVKTQHKMTFDDIRALWKRIPGLKYLQGAFLLNSLANALPATLFLFFVQLVLEEENMTGPLLILYFLSGVLGLPFWTMLAKKIGKKRSWQYSMLLASSVFIFVPFLESGDIILFSIISFVSGLSLGADMALPSSIQADVVQQQEDKKSTYAGLLFGLWAMITKFALALAVGLGFTILGLAGFDPNAPTSFSLTTLSLLYGGLPVLLKLTALLVMEHYEKK
jgi:GPH family glycoside/pentoside/hexuronide:cation symporter